MKVGRFWPNARHSLFGMGVSMALGSIVFPAVARADDTHRLFEPATRCVVCHNGLTTSRGEDFSLGRAWRPTMMANSARDPYWRAAVRREVTEHPSLAGAIEDECSKCHMPMATTALHARGQSGEVFAHFVESDASANAHVATLAQDGVSCSLCHQIQSTHLGQRRSMVGGFEIDTQAAPGKRKEFGPYAVDPGRAQVMRSASRLLPVQASHMSLSALCATCHTLYTHALDKHGRVVGELPEQVPYQEWLHSAYRTTHSCQDCHMPVVPEPMPIASVAGHTREGLHRHDFVGGNFLMQSVFARFGADLLAVAEPGRFELAALHTREHLESEAAALEVNCTALQSGQLRATVTIKNRIGHKLPTAYPSRRVWLHVTVRTATGKIVFESGALRDDGSIVGNDNDADPSKFEAHHVRIERDSEVAIYESILGRPDGQVTTGLLAASKYLKDNRLLPMGFDKRTAPSDVAVHGVALDDPDFGAGQDVIVYQVPVGNAPGPFTVSVELLYQPIGFRWAENLRSFRTKETQRFVGYYGKLARRTTAVLARASVSSIGVSR